MTRQLPLRIGFSQRASFENFIVGANGQLVRALVEWTSGGFPGELFYVWGTPGSGRSHLITAACAAAEESGAAFAYVPLGDSTIRSPAVLDGLENRYLVCLDDLDVIAGRPAWEEAAFHLYNRVRDSGGKLLVSANAGPAELALSLADLKSRLAWGTCYHVEPLDEGGKRELLRTQAAERGLELSPEAADFVLSRCRRDTKTLVSLMERLDTAAMAAQRRLTIPFLRTQLESPAGQE